MKNNTTSLTPNQALTKIKQFCSYQERCHNEVKEKLYSYNLSTKEVEQLTTQLIVENYLNEERFAKLFCGGKFRIKHWGKNKIKYELKIRNVSAYNIKKGLQEIDYDAYLATLLKVATQYYNKQAKGILAIKQLKTKKYLLQRGFELELINDALKLLK